MFKTVSPGRRQWRAVAHDLQIVHYNHVQRMARSPLSQYNAIRQFVFHTIFYAKQPPTEAQTLPK